MSSKVWLSGLMMVVLVTGCAWGGSGKKDAGKDDGGVDNDSGSNYPSGPYGSDWGDTVRNFQVQKCLCSGGEGQGRPLNLEELLGSKALLVVAHAGWCSICKTQIVDIEKDFFLPFKDRGFNILLTVTEDENSSSNSDNVLDFCCRYKAEHGLTFTVAADPGADALSEFINEGVPLNMLLDSQMVIRYHVEGFDPETLAGNIENLLTE